MTLHNILTEIEADLGRLTARNLLHPANRRAVDRLTEAIALLRSTEPIPDDDLMAVADAVRIAAAGQEVAIEIEVSR